MDLYTDIKKLTQIPQTDENIVFIRRKESYALKRNEKLKSVKSPRNENVSNCFLSLYSGLNKFLLNILSFKYLMFIQINR